jgi:hypothetical protein
MLPFCRKFLLATAAMGLAGAASAADPGAASTQPLEQKIDSLSQQLEALKAQLQQLKSQNDALANEQERQAQQTAQPVQAHASPFDDLSLWGYGEVYYTRPIHETEKTVADLARAVFGIGYRFDDKTHFNSEYEVEHGVTSADDPGEFEVEQFYVDHQFNRWASVEGGLFLIPVGIINEHHEPVAFYGVQRNFVETLIIPSTWREGGFAFHGDTDFGLAWNVGLTTSVNLAKWEGNPEDPIYSTALELINEGAGPLSSTHQELALADAQHLSQYLSLVYRGIPGLEVGAFGSTGVATSPTLPSGPTDQRVSLWESHVRWTPGRADLAALYARGTISNTAAYNAFTPGQSNPMPASFSGYYAQAAYSVWQNDTYRLAPFVRWERYNIGQSFEGIPAGVSPYPTGPTSTGGRWPQPYDRVWTYGANFYVTPHVVLKADYQSFQNNDDLSRFDLGLGLAF